MEKRPEQEPEESPKELIAYLMLYMVQALVKAPGKEAAHAQVEELVTSDEIGELAKKTGVANWKWHLRAIAEPEENGGGGGNGGSDLVIAKRGVLVGADGKPLRHN